MATAYTPGLKVSAATIIRKTRRLPLKGEVIVRVGEAVEPYTVVARTEIPGLLRTVRAADRLGIDPDELPGAMRVVERERVPAGALLAESRSFFGLFRSEARAPIDGVVEIINPVTGNVGLRENPTSIEVTAYIRGTIAEVMEGEGVVVETHGALVQGIFGVGGERQGALRMAVASPDAPLDAEQITPDMAGQVIVGGSRLTPAGLERAVSLGVAGIVVGAMVDRDLIDFLGYDIGVAITGHEAIPLTLILTEGFGSIRMADRTFRLLSSLEGEEASINGATQIRAGVIRPEVIVPRTGGQEREAGEGHDLDLGTPIRIIREPYFGQLATVAALPHELQQVPSGAMVRVLEARLQTGEQVIVPRANVEIIEE
ncbi:MAG: hypothetical protein ACK47B_26165 [Armatimonadota bacterium]